MIISEKNIREIENNPLLQLLIWNLTDGRAYTAVELSNYVKAPLEDTLKALDNLDQSGMLTIIPHRRHYYRLKNEQTIQSISQVLPEMIKSKEKSYEPNKDLTDLHYCRSCYNHLAGKIGVTLTEALLKKNLIELSKTDKVEHFIVTEQGKVFFTDFGIDLYQLQEQTGKFTKTCLDFSERKYHLGGQLGVALLEAMKSKGWFKRKENSRVHIPTEKGKSALSELLGMEF